jgi:hypothetical protein
LSKNIEISEIIYNSSLKLDEKGILHFIFFFQN